MSKSRGNVVDPINSNLAKTIPNEDCWRWMLLKNSKLISDSPFSRYEFAKVVKKDFSNGIGVIQWQTNDLNQDPGTYEGEIEIVRSTGLRETIYDVLKFRIREDFA